MDLNFNNSHTAYATHGFHTYPAKMVPQVANALLNKYGAGAKVLFDPYCGSGTSLVEANMHGINSIGTDLNPLARLIAKVKTTPIQIQTLDLYLKDFYDYLFKYRFGFYIKNDSVVMPAFENIDFWFSRTVKKDLSIVSTYIENIKEKEIKQFFQVALSQTIRECSWTRKNEFKLYKMSNDRIKIFKPDVFSVCEKILGRNRLGLEEFMKRVPSDVGTFIKDFDSSRYIPKRIVPDLSIDIVLTSPPYGDSSTTVAYGQFSALANQWLGFMSRGRILDKYLMGGRRVSRVRQFRSDVLNEQIREINKIDKLRALEIVSFYRDYYLSIRNVAQKVKSGGFLCYVVSNRTVKGMQLKTDEITKEFFNVNGFEHIETYERVISNKRMPKKNSTPGKNGKQAPLMNKEYILVMQKN